MVKEFLKGIKNGDSRAHGKSFRLSPSFIQLAPYYSSLLVSSSDRPIWARPGSDESATELPWMASENQEWAVSTVKFQSVTSASDSVTTDFWLMEIGRTATELVKPVRMEAWGISLATV
jgi:hypothetical protein